MGHLELLWVGYQTLCGREVGCLGRKDVSMHTARSIADARVALTRRPADVVVLSLTGDVAELPRQVAAIREVAPTALVTAVVCNQRDVEAARTSGVDDVTALESEGDLVCAPVLRWIDQRRGERGGDVVDLRGAMRRRAVLEREIERLQSEVAALERRAVRDRASNVFGRDAFVAQIELAAELLGRDRHGLALVVVEAGALGDSAALFGDFIVGGAVNRVTAALFEIGSRSDIVGRLSPSRFAVALLRCDRESLRLVMPALRERLDSIDLPDGQTLAADLCAGHLEPSSDPRRAARRLLDRVERGLDVNGATQVLQRR